MKTSIYRNRFKARLELFAAFGILAALCCSAFAGPMVPFKSIGTAENILIEEVLPSEEFPFGGLKTLGVGEGVASHEGRFTSVGEAITGPQVTEDGIVTAIVGTQVVTVANGDQLFWEYRVTAPGIVELPAYFEGSATITGGTGRFEGASGTVKATGTAFPDGANIIEVFGFISTVGSSKGNK